MTVSRREFIAFVGTSAAVVLGTGCAPITVGSPMYGLIGKINAKPGQRDALASVLIDGVAGIPGCLSYVVANDPTNADSLWVTEVWESKDAHGASLSLPSVQQAISKGRPMISGFGERFETVPLGGHGLVA
jgi:quinol monooxygenase YgiN